MDADPDGAMLALLETRAKRPDRQAVEQEELDEYPLLAGTSMMHYISHPDGPEDFPGFDERVAQWGTWIRDGIPLAREHRRSPFIVDYYSLLASRAKFERMMRLQSSFMDAVLSSPHLDIMGYWMTGAPARDTLMALCIHTRPAGIMLCPVLDPDKSNFPFVFAYADFDAGSSSSSSSAARLSATLVNLGDMRLQPVFYLLDFCPAHVYKVRARFPYARIVAIATPSPTAEAECLHLLRNRVQESL
jgi:hypothetical protein